MVVKTFSVTKHLDRAALGDTVTAWLRQHPELVPFDREVLLSSDNEFHCLTIVLFLHESGGGQPWERRT